MNVKSFDNKKLYYIIIVLLSIFLILLIFLLIKKNINNEQTSYTRTIMIYASPTNLEDDIGLATLDLKAIDPSLVDLDNVNVLLYTGGTSDWHNFISADENAIYKLTANGFEKIESYNQLNMAEPDTLTAFLDYSYNNFKTDKYDFIFYDHGNALMGVIADDYNDNDLITPQELNEAFSNSPFSKEKLEMVIFRTCLMGTLEIADILSNYSDYMVAASEMTLGSNPGQSVLSFLNYITPEETAAEIGISFIDGYKDYIDNYIGPYYITHTYSLIDLSKVPDLFDKFGKYISSIDLSKDYNNIEKIRSNLYEYAGDDVGYIDTYDLYSFIEKTNSYSSVDNSDLLNLFNNTILYNYSSESSSHGLSVYIPDPSTINNKSISFLSTFYMNIYNELNLNQDYLNFINKYTKYASGTSKTLTNSIVVNNESNVENNEFILNLSDEQYNDYASSSYLVFKKMNDDYYMLVYKSNNVTVEGKSLKTNITNKIIKLKNIKDDNGNLVNDSYLQIIDYSDEDENKYVTYGVAYDLSSENVSDWSTQSVIYNILDKNGVPYLSSIGKTTSNNLPGGIKYNIDQFTTLDFMTFWYKIFDENGNYTTDWGSYGTKYGYEVSLKDEDVELEYTSIDDTSNYYCIFAIKDIYGNVIYSKAVQIK